MARTQAFSGTSSVRTKRLVSGRVFDRFAYIKRDVANNSLSFDYLTRGQTRDFGVEAKLEYEKG